MHDPGLTRLHTNEQVLLETQGHLGGALPYPLCSAVCCSSHYSLHEAVYNLYKGVSRGSQKNQLSDKLAFFKKEKQDSVACSSIPTCHPGAQEAAQDRSPNNERLWECKGGGEGLGLFTIPRQSRKQEKYLSEVCKDYPLHKIGDLF